jgi:catechol 2,3-dioxygenase-like lactoylglutathione lyase family enzyme
MQEECHHIGLFTRDPEKVFAFYTEKMGFEQIGTKIVSKDWMTKIFDVPAECRLSKLRLGSAIIEIFVPQNGGEMPTQPSSPVSGYNHWALAVRDKTAFVRELEKKGVPVLRLEGTGRFITFVKDPEGNLIEIYQELEKE